ncbi:MAG: Uma2 family endonuclease [Tunicatimonas sp.]
MITVTEQVHRPPGKVNRQPISLEVFKQRYLEKKTYKYEWSQGWVEKKAYMKPDERYIIDNIITRFNTLPDYQKKNRIMAEADCYFSTLEAYRRPDAAYLTREQIKHPNTAAEAPALVIEVSSPSNSDLKNKKKILEYLAAGVQMVWYIYPQIKQVWIHTSPTSVIVCQEGDTCSANPAVPSLRISIQEIFE